MGVDRMLYGLVGLSLPHHKDTGEMIRVGLGVSDEDWYEKYDSLIEQYFYVHKLDNSYNTPETVGSYRGFTDGMSGQYFIVGKVLFEMEIDEFSDNDLVIFDEIDFDDVHKNIKTIFGLHDAPKEAVRVIVFVHYT